jgi:spermidine synthase
MPALFAALGFLSVIVQSILLREFMVVSFGNELSVGTTLAVWLLTVAVGAALYGPLFRSRRSPLLITSLIFISSAAPLAAVYCVRGARHILHGETGMYIPFLPFLIFTFLSLLVQGIATGLLFPAGCLTWGRGARGVAVLFVAEGLGFLAGGMAYSLFLVILNPFLTLSLASIPAGLTAVSLSPKGRSGFLTALAFVLLWTAGSTASGPLQEKSIAWRWSSLVKDMPLIETTDSRYQNLALTRQADQFNVYGNGQYAFSWPDPYSESQKAHLVMTECAKPRRVLVLGDVTSGLLRQMQLHRPERIVWVTLDDALPALIRPRLTKEEREVLDSLGAVIFTDGRFYVKTCTEIFDLVLIDLPDPSTAMLNRFYTVEFFREADRILERDGVIALHFTGAENYFGKDVIDYGGSIYRSVKSVFPKVAVSPGEMTWLLASRSWGSVTEDPKVLERRFRERGVTSDSFPPELFETLFEKERIAFTLENLSKSERTNSDMHPVTYLFNLVLWDKFSGSGLGGVIGLLMSVRFSHLAVFCALILAAGSIVGLMLRRSSRCIVFCGAATAASGFAAMGLEMVLIMAYQNVFGFLYRMIGLVIACFMLGLAVGGYVATLIQKQSAVAALAASTGFLAAISFMMPHLLNKISVLLLPAAGYLASQALWLALMSLIGALCGLALPLASAAQAKEEESVGLLSALDHGGGFAGALLTGTVLVPVLGTDATSHFIALVLLAASLLAALYARPERAE